MTNIKENQTNLKNQNSITNSTSMEKTFYNYLEIISDYINELKVILKRQGNQFTKGFVNEVENSFMKHNIPFTIEKLLLLPNYLLNFNDLTILGKLKDTLIDVVNLKKDTSKQLLCHINYMVNSVYLDLVYVFNGVIQIIEITEIYNED
jgi:hypothetical protein